MLKNNQPDLLKMKDKDRYRDVKEIQSRLEDEMTPLLQNAQNLVSKFASLCEELLFELLLRPILNDLSGVEDLKVWNAKSVVTDDDDEDDLDALPEYVHASTWIQQLSERFFEILRQLETHASEFKDVQPVTMRSFETHLKELAEGKWEELHKSLGLKVPRRRRRRSSGLGSESESGDEERRMRRVERSFLNGTIGSVANAATAMLLSKMLSVKRLSKRGEKQMKEDLAHYINVVRALGVNEDEMVIGLMSELDGGGGGGDSAEIKALVVRLNKMRLL